MCITHSRAILFSNNRLSRESVSAAMRETYYICDKPPSDKLNHIERMANMDINFIQILIIFFLFMEVGNVKRY